MVGARVAVLLGVALASGCLRLPPNLVYHISMDLAPESDAAGSYRFDPADSTAVFEQEGFRLKVRYVSDQELNEEYRRYTLREPNLNPFTYGTDRDLDLGYSPPRFTVFQVTAVNQGLPKVMVDPARMTLSTGRGGLHHYWDEQERDADNSFERYYKKRRGEGGNERYYYQERLGLVRQALYRRSTFVWQGDSYSGKVVFAPLHPDVRQVWLSVEGIVLRVDAYDRPTVEVTAVFPFLVSQQVIQAE